MKIRLQTVYAGPRGVWQAGMVMRIGPDISKAEAQELVAGRYATVVDAEMVVPPPAGALETADAAQPETAMVQTSGKKARRR